MKIEYCEHCGEVMRDGVNLICIDVRWIGRGFEGDPETIDASWLCPRCYDVAQSRIREILSKPKFALPKHLDFSVETTAPPSQTKAAASETQDAA